jgi:hypothetical protein
MCFVCFTQDLTYFMKNEMNLHNFVLAITCPNLYIYIHIYTNVDENYTFTHEMYM